MLGANVVYGTSYVVARVTLESIPPAMLAFTRLALGALALVLFSRRQLAPPLSGPDRRAIAWMGILGFAGAYVCSNWGIAHSTATNGALLITVEPIAMILLSPWYLGERLSRRGAIGAALTIAGTVVLVVNGIPGVTEKLVPHWAGDLVLVVAGVAYASYSLLGRRVLERHPPLGVTIRSLVWGAAALLPIAALEWAAGARPIWSATAVSGTLYLAVVITPRGDLPQRPADRGRPAGRRRAGRARHGLHGGWRHSGRHRPARRARTRRPVTVYSESWPSPAGISSRTTPPTA